MRRTRSSSSACGASCAIGDWCGREDSNFHGLSATATSTLRVYQFRHDRTYMGCRAASRPPLAGAPLAKRFGRRNAAPFVPDWDTCLTPVYHSLRAALHPHHAAPGRRLNCCSLSRPTGASRSELPLSGASAGHPDRRGDSDGASCFWRTDYGHRSASRCAGADRATARGRWPPPGLTYSRIPVKSTI